MKALRIKKKDSILDEIEKVRDRITKRAYEIFEGCGREADHDLDHWLQAERELVWTPPIEVEASDREIKVKISTPGIDAKNLDIEVAPRGLVVEAESEDEEEDEAGGRTVKRAKLFRSLSFEREIDPNSAKAELKDGVLTLTAKVADAKHRAAAKKVGVASR
jgi:HSP20 family molecular chaperone IbpA